MTDAWMDRPGIILRRATDGDVDGLYRMALELQDHVEASNPRIWRLSEEGRRSKRSEVMAALRDPDGVVIVAVDEGGAVCGMATARILREEKLTVKAAGSIETVVVEKRWRGRGIGTRLVAALCDFFDEMGVRKIRVGYVLGNVEGEAFWKGLGFEEVIQIADAKLGELSQELRRRTGTGEASQAGT